MISRYALFAGYCTVAAIARAVSSSVSVGVSMKANAKPPERAVKLSSSLSVVTSFHVTISRTAVPSPAAAGSTASTIFARVPPMSRPSLFCSACRSRSASRSAISWPRLLRQRRARVAAAARATAAATAQPATRGRCHHIAWTAFVATTDLMFGTVASGRFKPLRTAL